MKCLDAAQARVKKYEGEREQVWLRFTACTSHADLLEDLDTLILDHETVKEAKGKLEKWFMEVSESGVIDSHVQTAQEFIAWQEQQQSQLATLQAQLETVRRERDFIATQRDDLANALDAERTRREQVEMANYAKDGQIEMLQAERDRLREALGHIIAIPKPQQVMDLNALVGDPDGVDWNYRMVAKKVLKAALTPAAGGTRHGDTVRRVS